MSDIPNKTFKVLNSNPQDKQSEFKPKYGSLSLSSQTPNNFKIDDLQEYEYVLRQRACLYDPQYIKNSAQFKSFANGLKRQRVGEQSVKLHQTPAMQSVLKCIGLDSLIEPVDP